MSESEANDHGKGASSAVELDLDATHRALASSSTAVRIGKLQTIEESLAQKCNCALHWSYAKPARH